MSKYRTRNFIASENREHADARIHPAIFDGIKQIAKQERRTISWVIEDALSDYFGIKAALRKLKRTPKPMYGRHLKIVKRRA